jgi:predicted acyl esterase
MPALSIAALFVLTTQGAAPATGVRQNYDKFEYMIPMRDGVKLYTAVYVPKVQPEPVPSLLERTGYSAGPYGPDAYKGGFRGSPELKKKGYIFAYQDVRGKYLSEGEFVNVRPMLKRGQKGIDEATDTYDTVDFLVKNVRKNTEKL